MDFSLCVCLLISLGTTLVRSSLIVNSKQGQLKGKLITTRGGRTVYGYLGIPYAQPPVGELRFKQPEWPMRWSGVRDATADGPPCVQNDLSNYKERNVTFGSEDCLYLNVFAPEPSKRSAKLPVMVYIHGGGFSSGSSTSALYGPDYILDFDVVLVVINYRLGALGFLSTEDESLPGNYGLKDQREALTWVNRNIYYFGGSKRLITLFGHGAGAASTHLHMMSMYSKRLFHGAISQSGSALCPWAVNPPGYSKKAAHRVAKQFGCPTNDSYALAQCLRQIPAHEITSEIYRNLDFDLDPTGVFAPTMEKQTSEAVVTFDPWKSNTYGSWMVGIVSEEGAQRVSSLTRGKDGAAKVDKLNNEFNTLYSTLFSQKYANHSQDITENIRHFYFGNNKISKGHLQELINMYSDSWFSYCTLEAARRHKGPVYEYYFTYKGNKSMASTYGNDKDNLGVCHGDELFYLFPMDLHYPNRNDTKEEIEFSQHFVELWTNFAHFKRPTRTRNPRNSFTVWRPLAKRESKYLNICKNFTNEQDCLQDRLYFWSNLHFRSKPKPNYYL